jgi:hypothetical protein
MTQPSAKDVVLAYNMAFDPAVFARRDSYSCAKGGIIHAPNAYAYMMCRKLDADEHVKRFRHHTVRFPYWHPVLKREMGGYFDFDVTMLGGARRFLYVTPCLRVHTPIEEAMIEAAECVARDHKASFELVTEVEIFGPNPDYMFALIRFIMDKLYLTVGADETTSSLGEQRPGPV